MKVLFQHGWAYSAELWMPWLEQLPGIDHLDCPSRGYFSESSCAIEDHYDLIITHSFGLHLVPPSVLSAAKALFLIAPFGNFLGDQKRELRLRGRWLEQMRRRLKVDPEQVLTDFRVACGDEPPFDMELLNVPLLISDLDLLESSNCSLRNEGPRWLAHGREDAIVPLSYAQSLVGDRGLFCPLEGEPHSPSLHSLNALWFDICHSLEE